MKNFYNDAEHIQILIALMKAHKIKKVIASPGATNICLVASLQNDPYFEIYSSVDERSAAYIACGLAAETGEPVALSCTGATASRNYVPGLTEAFYRKLPILAITATQKIEKIGHNIPQVIDRSVEQKDIFKMSVQINEINNEDDRWASEIKINKAILSLFHKGGGPAHINLTTDYKATYLTKELPKVRVINRIRYNDELPLLLGNKIGIFVGAHKKWDKFLIEEVEDFCQKYNAIVFCDHTSNYKGKYKAFSGLILTQEGYVSPCAQVDILIHLGDISGTYLNIYPKKVWRVNPDGELCDTFKTLEYVFEMEEIDFFRKYNNNIKINDKENSFFIEWNKEYKDFYLKDIELPFSNVWIAQQTILKLPKDSILHLGILNSLRTWSYFDIDDTIIVYSNTGGFGIDGCVSSLIGASLAEPNKLFFGVVGDLAFFYDMNSIGNRHIENNLRIMIINNGRGTEFTNYGHLGSKFGNDADAYIAAAGHYGNKSNKLVKHYAEDLGFEYISASNKDEYLNKLDIFIDPKMRNKSVIFEIFTDSNDESEAIKIMKNIKVSKKITSKRLVKSMLGENVTLGLKKILKR
ncbi:thiamine pyrophosphate-binding protein [Megamonas hypermegale]|uniref:thiamine pyrophosphate-binding protein n=1 Tax=Megamonas hypermegale TaxID=158847 RepID=UPI0032080828